MLEAQELSADVDAHRALQVLQLGLVQLPAHRSADIEHEAVEATEGLARPGENTLDVRVDRGVGGERDCAAAFGLDRLCRCLGPLEIEVDDGDRGAFARREQADRPPVADDSRISPFGVPAPTRAHHENAAASQPFAPRRRASHRVGLDRISSHVRPLSLRSALSGASARPQAAHGLAAG